MTAVPLRAHCRAVYTRPIWWRRSRLEVGSSINKSPGPCVASPQANCTRMRAKCVAARRRRASAICDGENHGVRPRARRCFGSLAMIVFWSLAAGRQAASRSSGLQLSARRRTGARLQDYTGQQRRNACSTRCGVIGICDTTAPSGAIASLTAFSAAADAAAVPASPQPFAPNSVSRVGVSTC